jgi:protein-S-isoprenylcysteine O-methyltransferase Ste14
MAKDKQQELPAWFRETRQKGVSTTGNALFTVLRLLDLPLQYYILQSGIGTNLVRRLGGAVISTPVTSSTSVLGLSPYHSLIFGMAVGSAAKQIYWCLVIADNKFEPTFSTFVAVYNTLLNTFNTLLSIWALSSNAPQVNSWTELFTSSPLRSTVPIGIALYAVGIYTEWWCEVQRKRFRQNPANRGKLYTGGLFSLARNMNYGGYTLWRVGYGIVCAGLPWGLVKFAWVFGDFAARAVPYLETHLENKVRASVTCFDELQYADMLNSMDNNGQR